MSASDHDVAQQPAQPLRPSNTKRLTPAQRTAIVAAVAQGQTIGQVAQQFGVHRNSVSILVNAVRKQVPNSVIALQRETVQTVVQHISNGARDAIQRSVNDLQDVHKAATTGLSWLKGTGELAGDGGSTLNVFFSQVNNLPADWQAKYVSNEEFIEVNATHVIDNAEDVG